MEESDLLQKFSAFEDIYKSHDKRNFANYWSPLLTSKDSYIIE